jgi:hypothetical protein
MELFGDSFIPEGARDAWAGTQRCPRCIWPYLHPVSSVDQAHWLCSSCGRCWHLQHGRFRPVDPITCHGCAARARHDCIMLLQQEFPRFGAGTTTDERAFA